MGIAQQSQCRYTSLFEHYHRDVYAYCRRRTDAETARDCAAETFLVAWRKLDEVPDGDAALAWLYGVARRVLANEFRGRHRWRRLLVRMRRAEPAPDPTPEVIVLRRERDRNVVDALGQLSSQDRELLRLALWEELPHADIAVLLGCSTQAVTQRIYRATRRAAKEYQRLDHQHARVETPRQLQGGEAG